jgi:hypothetical protein
MKWNEKNEKPNSKYQIWKIKNKNKKYKTKIKIKIKI